MGFINVLINFARVTRNKIDFSEVEVDPGGGAIKTAEHFEDPGGDSHPLSGDFVATVSHLGTGGVSAVGYLDPINKPKAEAGEKIIYSRDEDGVLIAELWLKNDGTAILSNLNGSFELRPDGSMKGSHVDGSFELKVDGAFRAENANGSHELLADGSILGRNDNGSFELEEGGDFVVNTARIDTGGNITATSVKAPSMIVGTFEKELAEHTHGGVESGGSSTGPNQ